MVHSIACVVQTKRDPPASRLADSPVSIRRPKKLLCLEKQSFLARRKLCRRPFHHTEISARDQEGQNAQRTIHRAAGTSADTGYRPAGSNPLLLAARLRRRCAGLPRRSMPYSQWVTAVAAFPAPEPTKSQAKLDRCDIAWVIWKVDFFHAVSLESGGSYCRWHGRRGKNSVEFGVQRLGIIEVWAANEPFRGGNGSKTRPVRPCFAAASGPLTTSESITESL